MINDWFSVEIDVEKNNHSAEDLERKFFITRIDQRRVEKSWTWLYYRKFMCYI